MVIDPRIFGGVVSLIVVAFWAWCLYDFSRTDERDMGLFPRQVWLFWLTFGSVVGSLLWFFAGRPQRPR